MYLNLQDIWTIQLEHTSRCNCLCPQCARTHHDGTINPVMPITDLTLDDYKLILEPFDATHIRLLHCGNFGDALVSPTFDETYDYCLSQDIHSVKIMTNGSMRTPDWWRELAEKSGNKLTIVFSIDGLEDTNHIYRVGSNFSKIMANARAFIDAGGNAEWVFIKFNHNYHQVNEAQQIADKMGFRRFSIKTSARFVEHEIDSVHTIKNDIISDIPNNRIKTEKELLLQEYGTFENYVRQTPISCKFKNDHTIFIDMCMRVWPCCWFGGPLYFDHHSEQSDDFAYLTEIYGDDYNNLRKYKWNVLKHEFFESYLETSWQSPDDYYKRIYTCGRTCGDTFAYSGTAKKNIDRIKLGKTNE